MFSLELLGPSEPLWSQLDFPDSGHGQISRPHFGRAGDGSGRLYNPEPTVRKFRKWESSPLLLLPPLEGLEVDLFKKG
jgi:hypothetical protein